MRFGPYRTVSFDGCSSLKAPDTDRNRAWLGSAGHGGYPLAELITLVETGTRALIGAIFGPTSQGETGYARRLLHLLRPDMPVLWDKGFDGNDFLAQVTATGAQVLARVRSNRRTPLLLHLRDGSYLTMIGTVKVRVIDAQIAVTCADGTTFTGSYRLATTLTDTRRYPAATLTGLYHQRWEHESAYYALRHTLMNGRILRSGDPAGLEQEMWSVLTLYQLLRMAMVDAAESRPGTDPDRCAFTLTRHSARDQVVQAAGVTDDAAVPVGVIARAVLSGLLPARRPRVSTRKVKSPISRYNERLDDGRPDRSRAVTALAITVLYPPPDLPAASRDERPIARVDRRRQHEVLALLHQEPGRPWRARDIARHLGDVTLNTMSPFQPDGAGQRGRRGVGLR
ncbi:transposase [Planomonospora sp. ID91781]|uniref:transposase n=1 Tax=Planomonospora sp. ID91781 TaxID=2738135 RepID=UPI0018C3C260|nr:transposase [Planomonospora sp. ID91781]